MIRYHIIVSGRVQGVGFRYFASHSALMLNLTGWVRNCDDGTVEMEVQGGEEKIAKFLKKIEKGNMFVRVEKLSCKLIDNKEDEKSFKVVG